MVKQEVRTIPVNIAHCILRILRCSLGHITVNDLKKLAQRDHISPLHMATPVDGGVLITAAFGTAHTALPDFLALGWSQAFYDVLNNATLESATYILLHREAEEVTGWPVQEW